MVSIQLHTNSPDNFNLYIPFVIPDHIDMLDCPTNGVSQKVCTEHQHQNKPSRGLNHEIEKPKCSSLYLNKTSKCVVSFEFCVYQDI